MTIGASGLKAGLLSITEAAEQLRALSRERATGPGDTKRAQLLKKSLRLW